MRTSAPGTSERDPPAPGALRGRRGFTLLEILVVVAILGIAAAVGYATLRARRSRRARARGAPLRRGARVRGAARAGRGTRRSASPRTAAAGASGGAATTAAGRRCRATTCSRPRTLPASMRAAAHRYAGRAVAPMPSCRCAPSGRNEPYAFALRAREHEALVGADPLNRVAIAGPSPVAPDAPRAASRWSRCSSRSRCSRSRWRPACARSRRSADGAGTLKARTLALWVAQDRLRDGADRSPHRPPRAHGARRCRPARASCGRWTASGTPNPAFRRLDIRVAEADAPGYALARLTGYLAIPPR